MDNCQQNINRDISNNKKPFSTGDGYKSQKPIEDSNGVNSISVAVNTETLSQETLNLPEAVIFSPPNLVSANKVNTNKTNPGKVNPFIAERPIKGDPFSKTTNQDDKEHKQSNSDSDNNTNNDQSKNKKIYILEYSMIKNLKGWEMSKKLKNASAYVRHFAGVKVMCMKDHIKPTLREKTDDIVLHGGTNYLVSDRPPDLITKSIVNVASSMKDENHNVTISKIITGADHFKEKANE